MAEAGPAPGWRPGGSERAVAVLAGHEAFALGGEGREAASHRVAGLGRVDDHVHEAALGRHVRVEELLPVLLDQTGPRLARLPGGERCAPPPRRP